MSLVRHIPFRNIPNQSALFLDYLDLSPKALRFFQFAPTMGDLQRAAQLLADCSRHSRQELVSILRRQNEDFDGDGDTLSNINALEEPDCVAVLTGQQAGIFTGPLYTIYKALTAVHLADELQKRGIRAVPVFWMDTEDHDLAEVTRRTILGESFQIQTVDYREILFGQATTGSRPVGSIHFTNDIHKAIHIFLSHLPDSRWKRDVRAQLETCYKPGATFAQAFARLLLQILRGSGLILFDPDDPGAKRLVSPVFRKALIEADSIREALDQRDRELEAAGFHSQVRVLKNSTVLFYLLNGERCAIERRGSGFGLKGRDREFSLSELLECASKNPEKLSPNVLLRPVVQDHLFPTVAYVGGPAELAYFAQIQTLYTLFEHPMPVIWPRESFTILEPEIGRAINRIGICVEDCFRSRDIAMEKAFRRLGHSNATAALRRLWEHADQVLADIGPETQALDASLSHALETARRKILHNLRHLRLQAIRLEGNQAPSVLETVDSAVNSCYPNGNLQERELNVFHFFARWGPSLLEFLRTKMEIGSFTHHVLHLDEALSETT